jgi:hypothetical protein
MSMGMAVTTAYLLGSTAAAQNPKPPTPLPPEIQSVDQLPQDAVVLWIEDNNLTVHVDSTSNPDDQNKIGTLEIRWEGPGPGFLEVGCEDLYERYDWDFFVCNLQKVAHVSSRGRGPAVDYQGIIPDGHLETWNPAESWFVDGSYLTGGTLDKFDPNSPYFGPVPEPCSWTLLCIGLLLLWRRP